MPSWYGALHAFGEDVSTVVRPQYVAYRRLTNFACLQVHAHQPVLLVYVPLDPATVTLEPGFSRDARHNGHHGTGDVEIRLKDPADLQRAMELLHRAYEAG